VSHISRRRTRSILTVRLRLICDTVASLDARHSVMLRELNVVEQRYRAVLEVLDGIPVTEVAERFGVARQTVHRWMARYRDSGLVAVHGLPGAGPASAARAGAGSQAPRSVPSVGALCCDGVVAAGCDGQLVPGRWPRMQDHHRD
jgi:DNA-binding transcriptional ArsR family regulator